MPGMKSLTRPMLYRISIEHEMIKDGKYPNQSDFIEKPETSPHPNGKKTGRKQ